MVGLSLAPRFPTSSSDPMSDPTVTCAQCGTEALLGAHFCTICGSALPPTEAPLRTATAPQFSEADLAGIDQNFDALFVQVGEFAQAAILPEQPEPFQKTAQELLKPIRSYMIELEIGNVPGQGVPECREAIERLRALDPALSPALDELGAAFELEAQDELKIAYGALLERLQMDPRRSIPAAEDVSGLEQPHNDEAKSERAMDIDGRPKGKHTIVEEGSRFKGSLASDCPVDVRGRIDGEIETPALTVSASGAVHGQAKVTSLRSEGELSGTFDADTVELAGKVRDNTVIRAHKIALRLASETGKLEIVFGEQVMPASQAEQVVSDAITRTDDAAVTGEAAAIEPSSPNNEGGWQKNRRRSRGNRHSEPPPAE
jgi:cytoskeletal protein CcmA (bactofilin family)